MGKSYNNIAWQPKKKYDTKMVIRGRFHVQIHMTPGGSVWPVTGWWSHNTPHPHPRLAEYDLTHSSMENFIKIIFWLILVIDGWGILCEIYQMIVIGPHWRLINIGSGNGLEPSGNKPLTEPMMTSLELPIWNISDVFSMAHFLLSEKDLHYNDVIMTRIASQITSLTVVYSIVYSGADQRKHQSSASLAFVRGIHRGPVNSPHKGPVTRKMFPFDDVIMTCPFKVPSCGNRLLFPRYVT